MKMHGGGDIKTHLSYVSTLVGGEWSASRPCRFTLGEELTGTHWIRGLLGSRAGLGDMEK
jgi:hypothetical protein